MVTGHYTTNYTTEAEAEDGNWPLHYKLTTEAEAEDGNSPLNYKLHYRSCS